MVSGEFGSLLRRLKKEKQLSNRGLAKLADVPHSLIASLQTGQRGIGEYAGRKLGIALGLHGSALESFVLEAINTCTEKVLKQALAYPASLINHLPIKLSCAGISPSDLRSIELEGDVIFLLLTNGSKAQIQTTLTLN